MALRINKSTRRGFLGGGLSAGAVLALQGCAAMAPPLGKRVVVDPQIHLLGPNSPALPWLPNMPLQMPEPFTIEKALPLIDEAGVDSAIAGPAARRPAQAAAGGAAQRHRHGHGEHCNALIDDALAKGAKLVCGGKAENTRMPATLLDHVTPKMRIYSEETFGPVKCTVRVDGVEEAIACANDIEYGLSASVFGRDTARALTVAQRIDSGICHVNGPTVHDEAQMPFGGVKGSGWGRFGGKAGIAEFTELRWITVQTGERHYPFWAPAAGRRVGGGPRDPAGANGSGTWGVLSAGSIGLVCSSRCVASGGRYVASQSR